MTECCISHCDVLPHLTSDFGTSCEASCVCRYSNRFLNSVDELLCDSAGVEIFNHFLSSKFCLGHLLDFWFACKGFRCSENLDTADKLFQVAKVIYRAYIKSGALFEVPLPERVRADITSRMALYHTGYKVRYTDVSLGPVNRSLYDSAGECVKTTLEQVYYPAFQRFINDAHFLLSRPKGVLSSPDLSLSPSNSASSTLYPPANLSADMQVSVREQKAEAHHSAHSFTECSTSSDGRGISDQPSSSGTTTSCFYAAPSGPCCFSRVPPTLECKPIRSSPIDEVATLLNNPQLSDPDTPRHRNCHFQGSAFTTDSLLNSTISPSPPLVDSGCPSVAVNHGTHSCDDRPLNQFPQTIRKMATTAHASTEHATRPKSRYGPEKASLITHQDAACLQHTVDISKRGKNIAETDPTSFVLLLTAKLENVQKSRGKIAKLLSWVGQLDEAFVCEEQVGTSEPNTELSKCHSRTGILSPSSGKRDLEPQLNGPSHLSAAQPVLCNPSFDSTFQIPHGRSMRSETTRFAALATAVSTDEDAQHILDYHCSRIWADEHGHGHTNSDGFRISRLQYTPDFEAAPLIPNVGVDSTADRCSEARRCDNGSVARCHMTASSVPPLRSHRGFGRVQIAHRRRASARVTRQRTPHSDEKSTTSWDSGVADACALIDIDTERMARCSEVETNSIVAAASLQALSSSNTELATINSEVTEELLRRMTRYQLQKQTQPDRSKLFISAYDTESFAPNRGIHRDTFHSSYLSTSHLDCKSVTPSTNSRFSSDMSDAGPRNQFLPHAEALHCSRRTTTHPSQHMCQLTSGTYGAPAQLMYRLGAGRCASFHPASDSSSAFDSGISSTYDHLPCGTTQFAIQRDQGRAHRTRQPLARASNHPFFPHLSSVPDSSFRPYGTFQSSELDVTTACCPASYRDTDTVHCVSQSSDRKLSPAHLPTRPVCEGQLLQRWLRWQSSSEDTRSSALKSKRCQPTEHKMHRRHHHSRPAVLNAIQSVNSENTECVNLINSGKSGRNTCSLLGSTDSPSSGAAGLIVGYYLCDDPVPYRTVWLGSSTVCGTCAVPHPVDDSSTQKSLTLGDFKQLIAKKGDYRYFFKKESDEFGSGVVHEEIVQDDSILPLWDGKVIARVERAD